MIRFDTLEASGGVLAAFIVRDGAAEEDALHELGIAPRQTVRCEQAHGDRLAVVRRSDLSSAEAITSAGEADGLISGESEIALTVRVADCVPIYLVAPSCIALVHAGRRGTWLQIAAKAVKAMTGGRGVRPAEVSALIGPSAGPCCYEVNEAMAAEWRAADLPAHGRRLDLWEANRRQLTGAGVPPEQVEVSADCTICSGRYFSYRRGDKGGRNVAVLMRR